MRFRHWLALALIVSLLLCGCASGQKAPEQEATAAAEPQTAESETIDTAPTTLPTRPPEELLPEIQTVIADVPNARLYIDDGTICVDICDDVVTETGSIAYDRVDGGLEAWNSVVASNVALCAMMSDALDKAGSPGTPAKVTIVDHRFPRPILTIVDGEVVEDTVAAELANAPVRQQKPRDFDYDYSDEEQEQMVWISEHGDKYHSNPDCSNMQNPWQVPRQDAINMGRAACKICKP